MYLMFFNGFCGGIVGVFIIDFGFSSSSSSTSMDISESISAPEKKHVKNLRLYYNKMI